MKAMILVINASAHITTVPVTTPESGVATDDAELTAVLNTSPKKEKKKVNGAGGEEEGGRWREDSIRKPSDCPKTKKTEGKKGGKRCGTSQAQSARDIYGHYTKIMPTLTGRISMQLGNKGGGLAWGSGGGGR